MLSDTINTILPYVVFGGLILWAIHVFRGFGKVARDIARKNLRLDDALDWSMMRYVCVNIRPNSRLGVDGPITRVIYYYELPTRFGPYRLYDYIRTAICEHLPGSIDLSDEIKYPTDHCQVISWDHKKRVIEVELTGPAFGLAIS